ncbi:MAG: nucleotidyl transferase AbiEii/AbiGii toxin family protein [Rhodobacteraceae bacterium]|nr:nucleotidyl transferase AbiEii/AbiGii toxin family protein [Paracoccaceae bacterium]MCY4197581.1 nucleotidyl transferase AbiEii/AbiGii toxin family protein [Paracoccaceae bacterium]
MCDLLSSTDGSDIRFGGGTALALQWAHRHSTDLDFAVDQAMFDRAFPVQECQQIKQSFDQQRDSHLDHAPLTAFTLNWRGMGYRIQGVPVSLVRSRLAQRSTTDILSPYVVGMSAIHLVEPAVILNVKIEGRLIDANSPADRDGYDIAYALKYHPDIFHQAMKGVHFGIFCERVSSCSGVTGVDRAILAPTDQSLADNPRGYLNDHAEIIMALSQDDTRSSPPHSNPLDIPDPTTPPAPWK